MMIAPGASEEGLVALFNWGRKCGPAGMRVWRGFRSQAFVDDRPGFEQKLARIFVPQTAQQMEPLGLRAYFPALLPDSYAPASNDVRLKIPDEIALVVYPSVDAYLAAIGDNVAGRAYGLLHWPVFNSGGGGELPIPPSVSDHPQPWLENWSWNQSYYLLDKSIHWRGGHMRVLVACPRQGLAPDAFRAALGAAVEDWLREAPRDVDGSILCACPDYLLYWEHSVHGDTSAGLIPRLKNLCEAPYMDCEARRVSVPRVFTRRDDGVRFQTGDFLDVRLSRW